VRLKASISFADTRPKTACVLIELTIHNRVEIETMKRFSLLPIAVFVLTVASHAGLIVVGAGEEKRLDPSGFPAERQKQYKLMDSKCGTGGCHGLGRVIKAVESGVAPISLTEFHKGTAKAYGIKMMRKPDSGVNKKDARAIVDLIYFLIDEAHK
jgi:hypothetical protein